MRAVDRMRLAVLLPAFLICACGGGATITQSAGVTTQAASPTIGTTSEQNGAVLVKLASTTSSAIIYYTIDGSAPSTSSIQYIAPFLVASNLTVRAIAKTAGTTASAVTTQAFTPNIPSGTLVWSDEFSNSTTGNTQPSSAVWVFDSGPGSNFGNGELETYCAGGTSSAPCDAANPNTYIDTTGILHIVARQPVAGVYTSGRLKTQNLFSFQYGRLEARMMLPESQGMWPAFWLLGNNIATINWPACGEIDVMEHIDGANPENEGFDWIQGTIHGTNISNGVQYHPAGFSAASWHTYGMIWIKGQIQMYVDDPVNVYATYTPATQSGPWPFDQGPQYILLNLAVGGPWPGSPDATTVFPSEVQVDYVRLYAN